MWQHSKPHSTARVRDARSPGGHPVHGQAVYLPKVALSYVQSGASYYTPGWTEDELAQDIEGAKALLAEAGYDERNPLKLVTVTLPDLMDVYTVMQANLKEAGIELDIQQMDMGGGLALDPKSATTLQWAQLF